MWSSLCVHGSVRMARGKGRGFGGGPAADQTRQMTKEEEEEAALGGRGAAPSAITAAERAGQLSVHIKSMGPGTWTTRLLQVPPSAADRVSPRNSSIEERTGAGEPGGGSVILMFILFATLPWLLDSIHSTPAPWGSRKARAPSTGGRAFLAAVQARAGAGAFADPGGGPVRGAVAAVAVQVPHHDVRTRPSAP